MDFPLLWIYWNPDPNALTIPYFNHPIRWYGLFFVLSIFISYLLVKKLFARELQNEGIQDPDTVTKESHALTDRFCWFIILGMLIGARLGHVFFYDFSHYRAHPLDILKIWEGGLASHGGAFGMLVALFLFLQTTKKRYPHFSYIRLLDILAVPTPLVCSFIRIGNFFNQEILGTRSELPWAIFFGHPADGSPPLPRHPVQLYESFFYFSLFLLLVSLWKWAPAWCRPGRLGGLCITLAFSGRFMLEHFKAPMEAVVDQSYLQMGQLLSLPFILFGLYLLFRPKQNLA